MREAASFMARQVIWSPTGLSGVAQRILAPLRWWQRRRRLATLDTLDEHVLNDIGLSREDVRWALGQPLAIDAAAELVRRRSERRGLRRR
ncbi:DUF1127 domain-containing protein [Faunimonas sp. B44]|uniref:DUF1127 domain-containing protein n=1 Tax=Faunimonas sp. B44 TaxID=3461493 RepID=UPI0040443AC6